MDTSTLLRRAKRGLREDLRLYLVAVSSLSVAFFCLGAVLLGVANLGQLEKAFGHSGRITVYLRDGAPAEQVEQLRSLLEEVPEVASVEHLTAAKAREQFLSRADVDVELASLPPDVFPASLEIALKPGSDPARASAISERVGRFGFVEGLETYRGWFQRISEILSAGRAIAVALALLVAVCALAVVGNTIRLAVAGRRQEIEVMKLCGATDWFVRGPFLVEGAFQGVLAAASALLLLLSAFLAMRGVLDSTFATLTGVGTVFLRPAMIFGIVIGGALVGALGSAVALRRYLVV